MVKNKEKVHGIEAVNNGRMAEIGYNEGQSGAESVRTGLFWTTGYSV